MERRLIEDYFATVDELIAGLRPENLALAVEVASVPDRIRGYGHVKERSAAEAAAERGRAPRALAVGRWRGGPGPRRLTGSRPPRNRALGPEVAEGGYQAAWRPVIVSRMPSRSPSTFAIRSPMSETRVSRAVNRPS